MFHTDIHTTLSYDSIDGVIPREPSINYVTHNGGRGFSAERNDGVTSGREDFGYTITLQCTT